MNKTLSSAIEYAARGWPCHPLKPGEKLPILKGWPTEASCDRHLLEEWFPEGTDRNLGIITGERSGLIVIDVDPRSGGEASFAEAEANFGKLPPTARVTTGSGGFHLYFRIPAGVTGLHDAHIPGEYPGIDLKAAGNLVAPPSIHPMTGQPYVWDTKDPIAEAPAWLVDAARKTRSNEFQRRTSSSLGGTSVTLIEGGRNNALTSMAGTLRARGNSEAEILALLLVFNRDRCFPPLGVSEVRDIARSIANYEPGSRHADTDVGNARRLVDSLAGRARFDHSSRSWYLFDGQVWRRDADGAIVRAAKAVGDQLLAAANAINDPDRRKPQIAFASRSQSHTRIKAMTDLAQSEAGVPIAATEFDRPAHLLNVANGTVDLRTGLLRPHERDDLLTRQINIAFDPNALCPTFEKFVSDIFQGDAELIEFVQRVFGYAATGETREQLFMVLHGDGANGKSTLLKAVSDALGPYAMHTPTETLLAHTGGASNDVARLMGARFVTASEADANQRLNESFIKQVTGDEPVTSRYLYGEFFTYTPVFKLVLATNALPQVNGNDPALFRRLRLIPFNRVFTADEQDKQLGSKLAAELPGILAWLVRGAVKWYAEGLNSPAAVLHAGAEFRADSDTVGTYIEDRCELIAEETVQATRLFQDYRRYTESGGRSPLNQTSFGRALTRRGILPVKRGASSFRAGIKLTSLAA